MGMGMRTGVVRSADGTEIAFSAVGDGPAIVSVNGAMAYRDTHPTEAAVARSLADRYTVITYDRRGRGQSGPTDPARTAQEAVRAEVEDIAALIAQLGGGPVVLLGYSSGGVLSLEAVRAGLPITAVALWEPPFVVSDEHRAPVAADYRDRLQKALADGRPGDAVAMFMTEPGAFPAEFLEPMRSQPHWAGMERLAPTLVNDAAVMGGNMGGDPAGLQRYAKVEVPALVLYGDKNVAWFAEAAATIADVLPNGTVREVPGQDHDVAPEILVSALTEWLPGTQR